MHAKSPLILDTHDLVRRPGTMAEVAKVVPAPADLGIADVIGIPAGDPLTIGVRMEAVLEGVLVSGAVRGVARGECSRCLDTIELPVESHVQELFLYPERLDAAIAAGDASVAGEETALLVDDLADIEPVVRDSVVTALPFRPLCRPDCPGLCPECGVRLADEPGHHHEVIDPRWAALRGLLPEPGTETKES